MGTMYDEQNGRNEHNVIELKIYI